MKLYQVVDINKFFNAYSEKNKTERLPTSIALKIYSILRFSEEKVSFYNQEIRKIVDTYAEKDENGNVRYTDDHSQILLKPDGQDAAQAELDELNNCDVEFKYDFSDDEIEKLNLTLQEVFQIKSWFE